MATSNQEEAAWRSVLVFLFKDRSKPLQVGLLGGPDKATYIFNWG